MVFFSSVIASAPFLSVFVSFFGRTRKAIVKEWLTCTGGLYPAVRLLYYCIPPSVFLVQKNRGAVHPRKYSYRQLSDAFGRLKAPLSRISFCGIPPPGQTARFRLQGILRSPGLMESGSFIGASGFFRQSTFKGSVQFPGTPRVRRGNIGDYPGL